MPNKKSSGSKATSKSKTAKSSKSHKNKYVTMVGLQKGERHSKQPEDFKNEVLLKRTIGYRKRICTLSKGVLKIFASSKQYEKGESKSVVDLGFSVVSHQESQYFCVNTDNDIFRFKVNDKKMFNDWIERIRSHRLYRLDFLTYGGLSTKSENALVSARTPPASPASTNLPVEQVSNQIESVQLSSGKSPFKDAASLQIFQNRLTELQGHLSNLLNDISKLHQKANKDNKEEIEFHKVAHEINNLVGQICAECQKLSLIENKEISKEINASVESSSKNSAKECSKKMLEKKQVEKASETKNVKKAATILSTTTKDNQSHRKEKSKSLKEDQHEEVDDKSIGEGSEKGEAEVEEEDKEEEEKTDDNVINESLRAASKLKVPESKVLKSSVKFRNQLPVPMVQYNLSMWSFLRIGKDLSKQSLPIEMFEPVNTLQVLCEELEYSELLDQAASQQDVYMRMVHVACFATSRYAATLNRGQKKPFNPLEGETFENKRDDLGWNFIAEQVSHHPPITACHARAKYWEFWQSSYYHVAFWGKWIEAEQKTPVNLIISPFRERYTWNKVVSSLHNLFNGTKYFDHHGKMSITCSNGVSCRIIFKKANNSSQHEVNGTVHDSNNHVKYAIFGKWSEALYLGNATKNTCIWRANKLPADSLKYYGFTNFTLSLNELIEDLKEMLPPTDSRLRPDQRFLEEGKIKEAKEKKQELEENQRNRRKNQRHKPLWFKEEKQYDWKFKDEYWQVRKENFKNINFEKLW